MPGSLKRKLRLISGPERLPRLPGWQAVSLVGRPGCHCVLADCLRARPTAARWAASGLFIEHLPGQAQEANVASRILEQPSPSQEPRARGS